MSEYIVPNVWTWENEAEEIKNLGGNRPTAGSRFEQTLPVGEADLQLYSLGTPNGIKITILLEELKDLGVSNTEYDLFLIHIGNGDQFELRIGHIQYLDRKSTRLNSSHVSISYAVFCLKKKIDIITNIKKH